MLSMMLVYDFWNDYFLMPERLIGFGLIILGVALAFLAKRITKVAKKLEEVETNDKTYIIILSVSLVMILLGMIIAIL